MKSLRFGQKFAMNFGCIAVVFVYFVFPGCTDPQSLIVPEHLTLVPNVRDLQASVGVTATGKRRVLLTWTYDTTNGNVRTWDIQRSVNDSSEAALSFHEIVRRSSSGGYPLFADTSSRLQNFTNDSLDVFYRVIPNSNVGSYVGEPSRRVHVIVRR